MQPVPNPHKTHTFGAAPGDEERVFPLEVTVGRTPEGNLAMASCWRPTGEEMAALLRGEPVWLSMLTVQLPPALLTVGEKPFFLE